MRNISRLFVAFFAMLLLLCATAPAIADDALPPIATTQSFALGKDGASRTLWAEFVASKEPRHTWPAYWKDACVQTKIACTADVWKKLPVGFVVTTTRTEAQMQRAIAWAAFGARSAELVAQQKLMRDLNDLITETMEAQSELGRLTAALERKVQIVTVILAVLGTLLILGSGYLLFRVRPKRVQALPQNTTDHARFTKEAPHEGERKGGEISRASLPCTDEFTASAESLGRGDVATCSTPLPRDAYFPSETPRATFPPTHVPQVATRDEGSSSRTPNP